MKSKSHDHRLEELEDAFIELYKDMLTEEGVTLLKTGPKLRNKVLHGDFSAAAEKVEELKPEALKKAGVVACALARIAR